MKILIAVLAALVFLCSAPVCADTTIGWASWPAVKNIGATAPWSSAYEIWGDGFTQVTATFPTTATYLLTLYAGPKVGDTKAPLVEVLLDGLPLASGNAYSQKVAIAGLYEWTARVAAGPHILGIALRNQGAGPTSNLLFSSLRFYTITATAPPGKPPGLRDPTVQPYSSYSIWNTPIGSGATWSGPTDADTMDLRHAGAINAGQWSMPFFVPVPTDPLATFADSDTTYPLIVNPVTLHLPAGSAPALPVAGGDHHMIVYSANHRYLYHFFGCSAANGGFACGQSQRDDVCGDGLGGYGWGAGVIRKSEIQAGLIPHMLRYSLPTNRTMAGPTWITGLAWPAMRSDFNGPNGAYTGHVLYGSTFGIPSTVDITKLGLTPSGLVLARALQDYGAMQRDTGGSAGVTFYAEQSAEGMPQLADMRGDLTKVVPYLAIMRNQKPGNVNGGGTRRQPTVPGIDPSICQ